MEQSLFLPAELDFILSNFHYTSSEIKLNVISSQVASQCPILSISVQLVLRQFWWKVFGKAILENKFLSKTCQFRNKKETREFKHLRFYRINNLSPKLTKNQFKSEVVAQSHRNIQLPDGGDFFLLRFFVNFEEVIYIVIW